MDVLAIRIVASCAVVAALALVAVLVIGMATAQLHGVRSVAELSTSATPTSGSTAPTYPVPADSASLTPTSSATTTQSATKTSRPAPRSVAPPLTARSTAKAGIPTSRPLAPTSTPYRPSAGQGLPLSFSTGSATRVVTVTASSTSSTTATVQAWTKAPGGGWNRYGGAILGHVGSQGLTSSPSESKSATPIGSFTLTQAFGHDSNPGSALPYRQTDGNSWWISHSGSTYNTFQECSGCASDGQGDEHLYYETPYYNYAVVIDYNRFPVHAGAGSAFFLHVTDGGPTAGCVSIPQSNLVTIMKWLAPSTHPRILIGVS